MYWYSMRSSRADENIPADNTQIKIGAKASESVYCSQCQKEVTGSQCYTYKGKKGEAIFLCDSCREVAEKAFQEETKNPNIAGALFLGALAAIIAGIAWFAITVLTGYQIGYGAIGVGFLIGYAIIFGSGKKRGATLQMMSVALTLVTLFIAQYFISLYYIRKYLLENKAQFPDYDGQWFFVSPFSLEILSTMISPIGLLIWAVGIYFAYSLPKNRII